MRLNNPHQIYPDHILSSADKKQPCWQFHGRQKCVVSFPLEDKHVMNEHDLEGGKKSWVSRSTGKSSNLSNDELLMFQGEILR